MPFKWNRSVVIGTERCGSEWGQYTAKLQQTVGMGGARFGGGNIRLRNRCYAISEQCVTRPPEHHDMQAERAEQLLGLRARVP